MTRYLDEEEILVMHFALIERYGGFHGVMDLGRIKSVAQAVKLEVFGKEQYEGLYEKAAAYARNIITDHPFSDGNKRTGITAAIMFLQKNKIKFAAKSSELENFAVKIATDHPDLLTIAAWLESHSEMV